MSDAQDKLDRRNQRRPKSTEHNNAQEQREETPQATNRKSGESDLFYEESLFPDPEAVFAFQPQSLDDIRDSAVVVLDANALLLPYTPDLQKKSLDDMERIFTTLISEKRLVIPEQAAREFAKHRSQKLADMYGKIEQRSNNLPSKGVESFRLWEGVEVYDKMVALEQELTAKRLEYKSAIDEVLAYIRRWHGNDPISELYRRLFSTGVVYKFTMNKDDISRELERRKLHKIPPGYKDGQFKVGDLLIWYSILELGKTQRSVIFVSGDVKADWRVRTSRAMEKVEDTEKSSIILGPRYELVEEFRRASGGKTFQIIQFHELLDIFGASDTTVNQVKQVEATANASEMSGSRGSTPMQRQYVDSSNLRSVGYDAEQQILEIEFASGSVYQYFDVPAAVYEALMSASSKSAYHSQWIKYNFRYLRVG